MAKTTLFRLKAAIGKALLACVAILVPAIGHASDGKSILLAQLKNGTEGTGAAAALPTQPGCIPPVDFRTCKLRPIANLLQSNASFPNEAFGVVAGDGATTYFLKPVSDPEPREARGACTPPDDVSGCIIVPPTALNVKDVPKLTQPFLLKLMDGRTLYAFPAAKQ